MRHIALKLIALTAVIVLAGCASPGYKPVPPVAGTFERADVNKDLFLDYAEFNNYMLYKAAPYPEEAVQLKADKARGNGMMHKRFLMLDINNDGKLSYLEVGGGD